MKRSAFLLVALLALTGCRFGEPSPSFSDGYRVGRVEKFSNKGMFYKSYEGSLILQGYDRDDKGNMVVRRFEFSLLAKDAHLAQKIEDAMLKNGVVKVHYHQDWMGQIRYSTGYFVDSIEISN